MKPNCATILALEKDLWTWKDHELDFLIHFYGLNPNLEKDLLIKEIAVANWIIHYCDKHKDICSGSEQRMYLYKKGNMPNSSAEYNSILIACRTGDLETVNKLVTQENVNVIMPNSRSFLTVASVNNKLQIVKRLLEKGANVNLPDGLQNTASFIACKQGYLDLLRLLTSPLGNGNIDEINTDGETLLMTAVKFGQVPIVRELVSRNADRNEVANDGKTALHFAATGPGGMESRADAVLFIAENGQVLIDRKDENGKTALWYACSRGELPVAIALLQAGANPKQPVDRGTPVKNAAIKELGGIDAIAEIQEEFIDSSKSTLSCQVREDGRRDLNKVCVGAILDQDKRILLIYEKSYPLNLRKWGVPKGHFKEYENANDCVHREICEEIGLEIQKYRHQFIRRGNKNIIQINLPAKDINLSVGPEIAELKWVTIDWLRKDYSENPGIYNATIKYVLNEKERRSF